MRSFLICIPFALFPLAWSSAESAPAIEIQAQDTKGMKSFAKKLIREFGRSLPELKMEYEAEHERLVDRNGGLIINLANFYREYKSLRLRDRRDFIRKVVQEFGAAKKETPPLDQVRGKLTPKVWSLGKLEWMTLDDELRGRDHSSHPQTPVTWKLGDHLQGVLAIDGEAMIQYVNQEMVDDWKVPLEALVASAEGRIKTLGEGWTAMGTSKAEGGNGRFLSLVGDFHFAGSHLFERTMLQGLGVSEGALAAIPSEETLLILEPGDAKLDALFLEQIKKAYDEGERPLCPIPMIYSRGKWETWSAPEGHPQKVAFDNLERLYFANEYEGQKLQLDQLHTAKGLDVFVASYSLFEGGPGEGYFSMSIWTRGVDTLLPKTDYVAFVDVDRPDNEALLGKMSWSTFMEHFGDNLTLDSDRYMPRFRTRGYPDLKRIAELKD